MRCSLSLTSRTAQRLQRMARSSGIVRWDSDTDGQSIICVKVRRSRHDAELVCIARVHRYIKRDRSLYQLFTCHNQAATFAFPVSPGVPRTQMFVDDSGEDLFTLLTAENLENPCQCPPGAHARVNFFAEKLYRAVLIVAFEDCLENLPVWTAYLLHIIVSTH